MIPGTLYQHVFREERQIVMLFEIEEISVSDGFVYRYHFLTSSGEVLWAVIRGSDIEKDWFWKNRLKKVIIS